MNLSRCSNCIVNILLRNNALHRRCLSSVNEEIILPVNSYTERTHTCGQLSRRDIGSRVKLFGWVQYTRFDNKIIALRDSYGVAQCIVDKSQLTESFRRQAIPNESVLEISGVVKARPENKVNKNISTGDIEILAEQVRIIGEASADLPILTRDTESTTYINRLRYRYLDLRSQSMQHALRFRSQVCRILRDKLLDLNFVECETATLYNRTPGGANEFIVPTQTPKKFYSLVQSPQQMKQLLIIGGIDRYFQICRCYRDESGRSDRQPEFTQLDIELSFTNQNLVMNLIENLLYDLLTNIADDKETERLLTSSFDELLQFEKITFHDAIDRYGTDKPDARFDWTIESKENTLQIEIPYNIEKDSISKLANVVSENLRLESPFRDLILTNCESTEKFVVQTADTSLAARKFLGSLRVVIAEALHNQGKKVYNNTFKFLWVTDFPLFTNDNQGKIEPNHHPFTAPTEATLNLLGESPLNVVGQHYDLVLNGQEIAGGSIRIHDADLQRKVFNVLGLEVDTFRYFIEALGSGCPPHGGIAFGLDRLLAILLNRESIRDVIAFPKSNVGRDPLSGCPHELGADVKRLYHIGSSVQN